MSSSFCLYLHGWWAECDDCGWINVTAHTIYSSFSWPQEYKVLCHKISTHFTTVMKIIPSVPSWEDLKDPKSVWSKLKILLWISGAQLRIPVSQFLIMSQSCLKAGAGQQSSFEHRFLKPQLYYWLKRLSSFLQTLVQVFLLGLKISFLLSSSRLSSSIVSVPD